MLKDTQTGDTRELQTDGVFIFVGYKPNNHLVPQGIKMNAEGYAVTDEKCETNVPGIYVIGDLREKYAKQIVLIGGGRLFGGTCLSPLRGNAKGHGRGL